MRYEDLFLNKSNDKLKILYDQYIEWSKMDLGIPLTILGINLLKAIVEDWNNSLTQTLNVTENTEKFLNDKEINQIIEENRKK